MPRNSPPAPSPTRRSVSLVWVLAGWVVLGLALLGVLLPVLPTTPLVLLAAFFFGKGSPRLHRWLSAHRLFGPLIADWEAHGAIPRPIKRLACTVMALVFAASLIAGLAWPVLLAQALGLGAGAAYVLTRPDGPDNS